MAITALDRLTALVVIDLQKGLVGYPLIHPIGSVVEKAAALIDAFRRHDLPVVMVNVTTQAPGRTEQPRRPIEFPVGFAEFIAEVAPQPGDIVVTKRTWGAFASTDLEGRLKSAGVTQVVVIGIATATGVEATARQAYEAGFNITLAVDAMTDTRSEAHDYSIRNVFPRLGETGTTVDIIDMLATRSA